MSELKQGTRVRFNCELGTFHHGDDGTLVAADHHVQDGDMGMWAARLPKDGDAEMHMIAFMCEGEVLMVPAERGWFEVVG